MIVLGGAHFRAKVLGPQFGHFESPEGRKQNNPDLQAWEGTPKENRPERAADYRAVFPEITFVVRRKRLDEIS